MRMKFIIIIILFYSLERPAFSQTASQITPQSYAPVVRRPNGKISIERALDSRAPQGSDTIFVTIGELEVDGVKIGSVELNKFRSRLTGKKVSVAEIFAVARDLEASYAKAGEILTRVVVPPQDLVDGATVKLVVVRGAIEAVDTNNVPKTIRRKVTAILASLTGRPGISISAIERQLTLASDLPGLTLRSTLLPGSAAGLSILAVEGDYRPVTFSAGFTNHLPNGIGRESVSVGADLNGVAGLGETVYLRSAGYPASSYFDPRPRNRLLAVGFILPTNNQGLSLNIEGTDAHTAPVHFINQPGFSTRFQRLSARLSYPVVLRRTLRLTGTVSFDVSDERIDLVDPALLAVSRDRLRVLRSNGSVAAFVPRIGQISATVELSHGFNGLGARGAADSSPTLPLSRAGADAEFTSLRGSARVDTPVARYLALHFNFAAQTSFGDPLVNSESFGVTDADGISPLPQGVLQGDSGYVARGEVQAPFTLTKRVSIAPYGFVAHARVTLDQPTALERRNSDATAYGGGVRIGGGVPHPFRWSLAAEYGRANLDGQSGHANRFSISLTTQF